MKVLVTGGAGYIGSHTCVELLNAGFDVTVFDNLCNSKDESLRRVQEITGKKPRFIKADLLDRAAVAAAFDSDKFDAVIHFAGLKAVGESVQKPWLYYHNNISGSLVLFDEMAKHGVRNLVFSSSATVYGNPDRVPITEDFPLRTASPYGRTKLMLEDIQRDLAFADKGWHILLLRYFNPVGAHDSGLIGEDPNGIPNNLMPYITQVAIGRLPQLNIFGNDYPTPDGTCIRDFIHVVDLAKGHVKAVEAIGDLPGCTPINLGTGRGYSVLEIVHAFEKACGKTLPFKFAPRRAGDVVSCYADPARARKLLGWTAERGIEKMCRDAWNWQRKNPHGY